MAGRSFTYSENRSGPKQDPYGTRHLTCVLSDLYPVFPLSRFFSANRRFDGARVNEFWQYSKHSLENSTNLWKHDI